MASNRAVTLTLATAIGLALVASATGCASDVGAPSPASSRITTSGPADTKPADTKPADTKPAESSPVDTQPTPIPAPTGTTPPPASGDSTAVLGLREQVSAYSDAYLGGDPDRAFAILSARCQTEIGKDALTTQIELAGELYGKLPLRSYSETISGDKATVSYSYDVTRLDQTNQPWLQVDGHWRYDAC